MTPINIQPGDHCWLLALVPLPQVSEDGERGLEGGEIFIGLGGTKNTNFQNSMGALSNPISFAIRISKQFLFSF